MCDFICKSKVDLENHTKSVHKEAQLEKTGKKNVEKSKVLGENEYFKTPTKSDDCDEGLSNHKGSKHEINNASIIFEQGPKPLKT